MENNENILVKTKFNPILKTYILVYVLGILLITIVGIPIAIIWICGPGQIYSRHFYEKLYCVLTEKHLRFRMGILFTVDKTIPLENIQDLTFYEGPVLRYFNLAMLKIETAGQGDHGGNQMKLIGIIDSQSFRKKVLEQREQVKTGLSRQIHEDSRQIILLEKIAAILERIESNQDKKH